LRQGMPVTVTIKALQPTWAMLPYK
jgi:hypothetical protein